MAIKIKELPEVTEFAESDSLIVDDGTTTSQIKAGSVQSKMQEAIQKSVDTNVDKTVTELKSDVASSISTSEQKVADEIAKIEKEYVPITIDTELSDTSTNPVQNKVIKKALDEKGSTAGDGKITVKQAGTVKGTFTVNQTGDTIIELTDENTTYGVATTSANGLMSKADKTKLDGVDTGANKTVVDTALSSTSTNPVQNKVINTALSNKADSAIDNLTSTSTTNALSANQGKVLESEISAVRGGTLVIDGTTVTFTITES